MNTTIADRKQQGKIEREIRVIAKMIKDERKKQKMSLATLSEKVYGDIYRAKTLSEIERGLRPQIAFITICRILKALGIDVV